MKKIAALISLCVLFLLSHIALVAKEDESDNKDEPEGYAIDIFSLNTDSSTQGIGRKLGTVILKDTNKGLSLTVDLYGVPKGDHGFHVHQHDSCNYKRNDDGKYVAGLGAGEHYDPLMAGEHLGPEGLGHLGDLPVLKADKSGQIHQTVIAPRLSIQTIKGRSLVIHEFGDNYSDKPKALGGGGPRIACGVIKRD